MLFNATRAAAFVAILALGGGLALISGPLASDPETTSIPAAQAPGMEAAAMFRGSGYIGVIQSGEEALIDDVPQMRGQVTQMPAEVIEVDDPRVAGTQTFTQYAADYGSFGPTWGQMVIEDDEGAWRGAVSGLWHGGSSNLSGWLTGDGAYAGLVQYWEAESMGSQVTFSGAIYPAAATPLVALEKSED